MKEIDYNILEGSITKMVEKLIEDKNKGAGGTPGAPVAQPTGTGSAGNPSPQQSAGTEVVYPDLKSVFFKRNRPKTNWWEDIKFLLAFGAMVFLSAFMFCKGCKILVTYKEQSCFLLFFFGVIALLLVGLVLLAYFMIKASTKRHSELNERENKQLLFRQKMIEMVFELGNRNLIAEKKRIENEISMKEKDYLYSLDERQQMAEHDRKMQIRGYELIESYMKHVLELAKIEEKQKGSSMHLGDDFEISMVNPVAKIEKVPKNGEEKEYYRISFEKNS